MIPRVDVALSLILVAIGIAIIAIAELTIRTGTVVGDLMGPRAMPRIIGGVLIVCAGTSAMLTVRSVSRALPAGDIGAAEDEPDIPASATRAFAIMGLTTAYAVALDVLGYPIATPLYFLIALWLLDVRGWLTYLMICVALPVAMFLIFAEVLGVLLPAGLLEPVLS